jgi:hypothetical protein
LYFETLTDEQKRELWRRYEAIDLDTDNGAWDLARNAAIEVIGEDNRWPVYFVAPYPEALTFELIAMHLLLERDHSLTIAPLIKDL